MKGELKVDMFITC